jgi:hypothetical protein
MVFTNQPILTTSDKDGLWYLVNDLIYQTKAGEIITVPSGFDTDLASIPQIFHSIIPVNGRHRSPAIIHDYLYVIQDRTRSEADAIFLEAMESVGVRWTQRYAMYWAVRLGGLLPWNKRTEDKHANL